MVVGNLWAGLEFESLKRALAGALRGFPLSAIYTKAKCKETLITGLEYLAQPPDQE
jgi:hypothetical protein